MKLNCNELHTIFYHLSLRTKGSRGTLDLEYSEILLDGRYGTSFCFMRNESPPSRLPSNKSSPSSVKKTLCERKNMGNFKRKSWRDYLKEKCNFHFNEESDMSFPSDNTTLWKIWRNPEKSSEQRCIALGEMLLRPIALLAILSIPGLAVLRSCGLVMPSWVGGILQPILVAGAIGYLTNWIAIAMLFKPYEKTWRHPFAWISLGYLRQGLVPKNKKQIAATVGRTVAEELLHPEEVAKDLCGMVSDALDNPELLRDLQTAMQTQVLTHQQEIIDFLAPKLEAGVLAEIDRLVTPENVQRFWNAQIEPRLASEEFREHLAAIVVAAIQRNAPVIAEKLRPALKQMLVDYCYEKGGFLGGMLAPLAEGLADKMLSPETLKKGIAAWLDHPDTMPMLREELVGVVTAARDYIKSPEVSSQVQAFTTQLREQFKCYLQNWLQSHLAPMAEAFFQAPELWNWITTMLQDSRPRLEKFLSAKGMPLILERLNIQGRIQDAVDRQNMARFHSMVNEVAAQHLGAIQILGFFLGMVAGALMLWTK